MGGTGGGRETKVWPNCTYIIRTVIAKSSHGSSNIIECKKSYAYIDITSV